MSLQLAKPRASVADITEGVVLFVPLLLGSQGAVLVRGGVATAIIDLPSDASPSLRYGADRIGDAIQEMSGGTLPVGGRAPVRIVLRTDKRLGPEEFDLN